MSLRSRGQVRVAARGSGVTEWKWHWRKSYRETRDSLVITVQASKGLHAGMQGPACRHAGACYSLFAAHFVYQCSAF